MTVISADDHWCLGFPHGIATTFGFWCTPGEIPLGGVVASSKLLFMERRGGFEKNTNEKSYQLGKARDGWRENMLDVRLDGEAFALPYAHLSLIKCEGERALTLSFSTHLVKIEGERLRPLYEALIDHAVRYVVATEPRPRDHTPSSEPVITAIDLVPLGQSDQAML